MEQEVFVKKITILLISLMFLGSCAHYGHSAGGADNKAGCAHCKEAADSKEADCGCKKDK